MKTNIVLMISGIWAENMTKPWEGFPNEAILPQPIARHHTALMLMQPSVFPSHKLYVRARKWQSV